MEYNIKHEKLLTKRLKSSTIVNCNENKKLIEVINKMKDNLNKIKQIGGFKSILPSEGIVFRYKGKIYKLVINKSV